jgi:large subunit ribosomal protein L3
LRYNTAPKQFDIRRDTMDLHRPRRGSRGFRPRKRSETQVAPMFWPDKAESRILGFAGYKVGMATISYVDQSGSPSKGQEKVGAGTIVEVPPMYVYGVRLYNEGKIASEEHCTDAARLKELGILKPHSKKPAEKFEDVRLLVYTQPSKTLIGKKHPERFELGIGGKSAEEKAVLARGLVGKEMRAKDVFKPGELIDVVAITKGKGWQGPVKRFGANKQRPKATNKRRHVGTLGQWHPAYVLYTAIQGGQTGYHKRTELNKAILKISDNIDEINPSGGFPHYGFVKNDYIVIKGSLPGPTRRLIKMRVAARDAPAVQDPKAVYVSNEPRQ